MEYKVLIDKYAEKQIEKISEPDYSKIKNAINSLAKNPRPIGYKKLKGNNGYRIRIGDYRVIYSINDMILTVYILLAGHRKNVYD